ncbi:LysR substrate-binding domain-containing protein [Bartonella tamiae]
MHAFVDVVEAEGFSAAGRKTHKSKALLSKHVRELEDELGVLLLNRTTRQLSLTEAGHSYYLRALEILKELDDLQDSITQYNAVAHGRIKISASRTFADAPIGKSLVDFLVAHPKVHLEIHLDDRFVDLVDEGFDLGIRFTRMEDSSLIARRLTNITSVVVTSPELLKRTGIPLKPQDLRGMPCLIDRNNRSYNNWTFMNKDGSIFSIPISGPMEVNGPIITRTAAIAGIGFARMPHFVAAEEIQKGRLVSVLDDYTIKDTGVYAVYPHRRYLPAKVRFLVDYLVQWFKIYDKRPVQDLAIEQSKNYD